MWLIFDVGQGIWSAAVTTSEDVSPAIDDATRPGACWNVVSALCPIVIGVPIVVLANQDSGSGWGLLAALALAIVFSAVLGISAAIFSLRRNERLRGLSWFALVLHIVLLLALFS